MYKNKLSFHLKIFCIALFSIANTGLFAQNKTIELKAKEIISQMTLDEKINMIVGDGKFLPTVDQSSIETGTGIIIENQNSKLVIPRLRIRSTAMTDGPAGVNRDPHPEGATEYTYTTAFPTGTCLAATWNTELMEKVGLALGNEVLEYGYDVILAPGLNIHRDPKCGRNFEYYSEDPLLSGKLATSIVNGIQSNGVDATIKHFLANNQESNRRKYNAVMSQRALREIYLRGFEIAVKESNPGTIMTSYNKLNGFYPPEAPELLQNVVRDEWGFEGLFMTDFDMNHGDAVAQVRAGINMILSGSERELNEVRSAVENKILDESILDHSLFYNMKLKSNSPLKNGYKPSYKPDLEAHAKIAREALGEGIVLLKNDNNTLPLSTNTSIAVLGKTSYHMNVHGTGSGGVRGIKYSVSVYDGLKSAGFNVLKEVEKNYLDFIEKIKRENLVPPYFDNPKMRKDNGIKGNQAPPHFKERLVAFSKEQALSKSSISQFESNSDVAVITLGRSGGENYENGLIPIRQLEIDLIKDVCVVYHAANKKVVVILNVGGVWDTSSWKDYP
ncbi:MAG: glycoside hydrolase family 3 protein, partial [Flavobacteriaceae bacterium]|nr:glycoside hydrolase family 3 protein [Flavobacteriaceae bacterium]